MKELPKFNLISVGYSVAMSPLLDRVMNYAGIQMVSSRLNTPDTRSGYVEFVVDIMALR
jgi:hypothetical protein